MQVSESAHMVMSVDEICCPFSQNLYQQKKKKSQKLLRSKWRNQTHPTPGLLQGKHNGLHQLFKHRPLMEISSVPFGINTHSSRWGHFSSNVYSIVFLNALYPRASDD